MKTRLRFQMSTLITSLRTIANPYLILSPNFKVEFRRLVEKISSSLKSQVALWRSSAPSDLWRQSLTSSSPSTAMPSSHRTPRLFSHQVTSASGVFFLYAAVCVLSILFTIVLVPETKGRNLEEIQASIDN
ncbi:hypothetical protein LWI28_003737 [Acer negundo]|uniref:Uncharacterized protein n=1 Tax=Acer negundo TaxID=4023 RepID=A0AAD5IT97_ACENE|nr:hypothetical protein LWI28_003737 [Acer negundo]